jgi:hypothetical protein
MNIKNLDYEHKAFAVFLIIHLIVWTCIGLIRTVLPTDALEGIYWGSLFDFGTPKHPPLSGWIGYGIYSLFKTDFSIYFISQAFITLGFIYIYKIARFFLDTNRSILSVIILEGCWVYTYITGYYGFNPDVILLGLLPVITYYFYRSVNEDKLSNWVLLGIFVGLSFLNKYQTVLVLIPMFIWAIMFRRGVFKTKKFYISVLIAFLLFLPHILWLIKYDFFPLLYFEGEFEDDRFIKHIVAPLQFFIVQLSLVAASCVLFVMLKLKQKSEFLLNTNIDKEKTWFLLLFCLTPLVIHVLMGICGGGTMRPRWGFVFVYLIGIMLFYFIKTNDISLKDFKFVLKSSYVVMFITFIALGTLLAVEKNYRSRYPVSTIYNDMVKIWQTEYNTPLKYFGGYIEWTLPLTIYGKEHQHIILDTHGYPSPWLDENDIKKSGIIVIDRKEDELYRDVLQACPYLGSDYVIDKRVYKFELTNAFNMPREYQIFYTIIPPME